MPLPEDYLQRIAEQDIPALKKQLEPMEAGDIRLREHKYGADGFTDITPQMITMLKRALATYEAILAAEWDKR
jgi:hypothetical protein